MITVDDLPMEAEEINDPEFERLLAWYVKKRNHWIINRIEIAPEDTFEPEKKRQANKMVTSKVWGKERYKKNG